MEHMGSDGTNPKAAISGQRPAEAVGNFPAAATSGSTAYRIGSSDVLEISVFKVPDLSKTVQVADSGSINLPLVGEVPAAGRTTEDLERDLTARLGAKYLQNPQVTVFLKEANSQRVTIEGAVKSPGVFPIRGRTTLLQSIAMAGGLDPSSDSTVLVLRASGGKRSAGKFDLGDIAKGVTDDPAIQSGDVVVAGTSAIKKGFNTILKALPVAGLFAFL
jgi:polysaccharide biosynthesis/export protein